MSKRNKKQRKVLLSGSLGFDVIFRLNGTISDQITIKNCKPGKQNLMFTAAEKEIYQGGIAGNIAYGLGILGEPSFILSAVGKDFDEYELSLKQAGILFRGTRDINGYSSTCFSMTDERGDQIGIFQGGIYYKHAASLSLSTNFSTKELKSIKCAIFSAGTAEGVAAQITEFRTINKDAFVILDLGQIVSMNFSDKLMRQALKGSNMVIFNETESAYVKNFGIDFKKIFSFGITCIIETRGGDGSILFEPHGRSIRKTIMKAHKTGKVVDSTGAGDAYRAGIIYGIINNKSIEDSMYLASKMGAECVKYKGTQTYAFPIK